MQGGEIKHKVALLSSDALNYLPWMLLRATMSSPSSYFITLFLVSLSLFDFVLSRSRTIATYWGCSFLTAFSLAFTALRVSHVYNHLRSLPVIARALNLLPPSRDLKRTRQFLSDYPLFRHLFSCNSLFSPSHQLVSIAVTTRWLDYPRVIATTHSNLIFLLLMLYNNPYGQQAHESLFVYCKNRILPLHYSRSVYTPRVFTNYSPIYLKPQQFSEVLYL